MSKLQDICRSIRVFNDYEFFGDKPYIWLYVWADSRDDPSHWRVTKRGEELSTQWYYDGDKAFTCMGNKKEAFQKAKDFMSERWGIQEVSRSPFGGYGDSDFVKARIKEIKQLAKELKEK